MIKKSIAAAFLVGAITGTMNAVPQVTFVSIPGSGMGLILGSSAQFTQTLTDYFGPDVVSLLQPILPYLAIG